VREIDGSLDHTTACCGMPVATIATLIDWHGKEFHSSLNSTVGIRDCDTGAV
jgi:hypothetical protein